MSFMSRLVLTVLGFFLGVAFSTAAPPETWMKDWNAPPAKDRPLQIIHGNFGHRTTPETLRYFKDDCGLGGLVINVASREYLRNEAEWQRLVDVVRSAKDVGLRIWIYDEDGYPSLMAGGVVLDGHPELESLALVYDATKEGDAAFQVRPAYEYTHASNKHAPLRRYPNPLDPAATKRFLEVTHEQYKKRLGELHGYVEAYFTDEPSLNAVNLGQIPEHIRVKIRTVDPVDPNVPLLPMVPWSDALQKELEKGGPFNKKSLFVGDGEADRAERRRFWDAVTRLNALYFYQPILDWCRANGVASSGHMLREESLVAHVPLDGNKLTVTRLFDIPGLDQLSSDPKITQYGGWKALAFPCSAAALNGTRLVMTEISDHSQRTAAKDPKSVDLPMMKAASACEAAWGVTEFTLYYRIADRGEAGHKEYGDYVGRLNAILRPAKPLYSALLYYPVPEMQEEYRPTAEPIKLDTQSKRLQETIQSFDRIGSTLVRSQVPFVVVDQQGLKDWIKLSGRKDWPLFVPRGAGLPEDLKTSGVKIVDDSEAAAVTKETIQKVLGSKQERFSPMSDWLTYGKFERDGRTIYVVVNGDDKPYAGTLAVPAAQTWSKFDPETGTVEELTSTGAIPLSLEPYRTLIFVGQ